MSGSESSVRAAAEEAAHPIALTVHSLPAPALAEAGAGDMRRRTRTGRLRMLLVLAVCAAPVVASYLAFYLLRPGGTANYGVLIHPERPMPALTLTTLDGAPRDAAALQGQWLLLRVGPARCGPACEQQLFFQRQMREMLGRERERVDKVWLVTDADPVAAPLRHALEGAPTTTVLRAPAVAIAAWLEADAGRALEDHLYVVDPVGRWMMRLPADPDPSRVRRDLERLLRASASWDRPGRPGEGRSAAGN